MEARDHALAIVTAESLEAKLAPAPGDLTDAAPGLPLRLERPGRPDHLRLASAREVRVPPAESFHDPRQRQRILHALANHELQATELFAWALLAFPEAPREFRAGLVWLVAEEQRHTKMYLARLADWGVALGDHPVTGYFWNKTPHLLTPLHFVCALSLTFENANLDHAAQYAAAARATGDERTARLFDRVGEDEVLHVRFGWRWLLHWKAPGETPWEAYTRSVAWPLRPALARGDTYLPEPRLRAGLDPDFVDRLAAAGRAAGARKQATDGSEGSP